MPRKKEPKMALKPWESLTTQQQTFVENYLANGHNSTRAYLDAGYYAYPNSKTANYVEAWKVRWNPNVNNHIIKRMRDMHMDEDEALARHAEQGRFDPGDFLYVIPDVCPHCQKELEGAGSVRVDVEAMKKAHATRLIKKVIPSKYGDTIEFYPADSARRDILQAHGSFQTQAEEQVGSLAELLGKVVTERTNGKREPTMLDE